MSLLLNAANTEQSSLESDLEFITHHKVLGSDLNTDRLKVHSKMLPSVFRFVTIENKKLTVASRACPPAILLFDHPHTKFRPRVREKC